MACEEPLRMTFPGDAKEIDLFNGGINDEGAEQLASQLMNSSVELLRLHTNDIATKGACSLAVAISCTPTLRKVILSRNPIGDAGACAIAAAVISSEVESLFLDGCGITDTGAIALADALRSDCALTEIYLDNNPIGDRGIQAIAKAVEENPSLCWLFLDQSLLPSEAVHYTKNGVKRMRIALGKSTSIQAVRLSQGTDSWLQTEPQLGSANRLRFRSDHITRCLFLLACERESFGQMGSRLSQLPIDVLLLIVSRMLPRRQRKLLQDKARGLFGRAQRLRSELQLRSDAATRSDSSEGAGGA